MKYFLLAFCLALPVDVEEENPSRAHKIGHAVGHAVGTSLAAVGLAAKTVGTGISRGAKVATHKVLTSVEHSARYVDEKVKKSIHPPLNETKEVVVEANSAEAPKAAPVP